MVNPAQEEAMALLAQELTQWQQAETAVRVQTRCPQTIEDYLTQGADHQSLNQWAEALAVYGQGLEDHPQSGRLHRAYVTALHQSGQFELALQAIRAARIHLPHQGYLRWAEALLLPILYQDEAQIAQTRARFTAELTNLIQTIPPNAHQALAGVSSWTNYYLAYQGQDDRAVQEVYGDYLGQVMACHYPQWTQAPPSHGGPKVRVGYVSGNFYNHAVGRLALGWVTDHDRHAFDIYCYYHGSKFDKITSQYQAHSHFYHQGDLERLAQQMYDDQLDILVYLDPGVTPLGMQLAALRLAPIQATTWLHPITSGLSTMDYFFSNQAMECSADHYCEQLITLPGLGVVVPAPPPLAFVANRARFGISSEAVIYLNRQHLSKYLPQHDRLFAELALRVPQARLIWVGSIFAPILEQLKARLAVAFAEVGLERDDYCQFLPYQSAAEYWQLNQIADVFLDSLGYSGCTTSLDALAVGLPVVTCSGRFLRERQSAGVLDTLGVRATIAPDSRGYLEIAVQLGLNPSWRQQISQEIQHKLPVFYQNRSAVRALEHVYRTLQLS